EILLGDPAERLVENHHPVPLGLFLAFAGCLVAPAFRGGNAQIRDRAAVLGAPDLGIPAEIADEDHFVDRTCHDTSPLPPAFLFQSACFKSATLHALQSRPLPLYSDRALAARAHAGATLSAACRLSPPPP